MQGPQRCVGCRPFVLMGVDFMSQNFPRSWLQVFSVADRRGGRCAATPQQLLQSGRSSRITWTSPRCEGSHESSRARLILSGVWPLQSKPALSLLLAQVIQLHTA